MKPLLPLKSSSTYPRVVMESLLLKAEWWLQRNLQEMPFMGEDRLRKEGENKALGWVIENMKKELRGWDPLAQQQMQEAKDSGS